MTARLNDRELDTLLANWLDEGPSAAAGFVVEQALARVPTVRRRAGWWPQLPTMLRTHGPLLAAVAVLLVLAAGVALAVGMITKPAPVPPSPPVAPSLDASASPSIPEPTIDPSATPKPVAARGTFEFTGPVGAVPAGRTWDFIGWDDATYPGLKGYQFNYGCCGAKEFYVRIYHDERTMTAGTYETDGSNLIVLFAWQQIAPSSVGTFWSKAGECVVTFDDYSPLAARGSLACIDVPGEYGAIHPAEATTSAGTVSLTGTFAFDPSVRPPGEVPSPTPDDGGPGTPSTAAS